VTWYSIYGTGATLHGVTRAADGRVEFTAWLSLFWIPLLPLSSWSGHYAGEADSLGDLERSERFTDLKRIPHDPFRLLQTSSRGLLTALLAAAPAAYMIYRTNGRAATIPEFILVLASALWPILLVIHAERSRRRTLKGA
jgi:hypothetical protein